MVKNIVRVLGCLVIAAAFCLQPHVSQAADVKIGVIDVNKVLTDSTAGKRVESTLKSKASTLNASLKLDENALNQMQEEAQKKSSAWNADTKRTKAAAFEKKRAEFFQKQKDASTQMQKLREQQVGPIMKKLQEIVGKIGSDGAYSVILPQGAVIYTANSVDLTDQVISKLNSAMK